MKKILLTLTLLSAIALTGCNTTEGFGRDMERAGESVQDAAR